VTTVTASISGRSSSWRKSPYALLLDERDRPVQMAAIDVGHRRDPHVGLTHELAQPARAHAAHADQADHDLIAGWLLAREHGTERRGRRGGRAEEDATGDGTGRIGHGALRRHEPRGR
jgi:hypothetical protein